MRQNKVLGLLGLAARAGKVVSGEFSTERAVKAGKAALVIVAAESSENTRTMFRNLCAYYKVPCCEFGGKEELGHAVGKELRASLAVTDPGFARAVTELLEQAPAGGRSAEEAGKTAGKTDRKGNIDSDRTGIRVGAGRLRQ